MSGHNETGVSFSGTCLSSRIESTYIFQGKVFRAMDISVMCIKHPLWGHYGEANTKSILGADHKLSFSMEKSVENGTYGIF